MAKRFYMPILVGLVGVAVVGILVYGISTQSPTRSLDEAIHHGLRPRTPDAGSMLPLLLGSGERSLASFKGRVVILNFWASWCKPCEEEAPSLERTQQELSRHGGTVLGVTFSDTSSDSLGFTRRFHLTYPSLRDTTGEFTHAYGTIALPESFVIDRDGHVTAISRGEVNQTFLNHAVSLAKSS